MKVNNLLFKRHDELVPVHLGHKSLDERSSGRSRENALCTDNVSKQPEKAAQAIADSTLGSAAARIHELDALGRWQLHQRCQRSLSAPSANVTIIEVLTQICRQERRRADKLLALPFLRILAGAAQHNLLADQIIRVL